MCGVDSLVFVDRENIGRRHGNWRVSTELMDLLGVRLKKVGIVIRFPII